MSDFNSTAPASPAKPNKPHPDFPLFPHATGLWAKKIRGKMHYFGPWANPDGALAKYLEQKEDLHAGKTPRPDSAALTVKALCNQFLNAKQTRVDGGELSPRTWTDYKDACAQAIAAFGKTRLVADLGPDDFSALRDRMAKTWGPHRLKKALQCVRSLFKYAFEAGLIDRPARFGPGFRPPSAKTLRLHRASQGPKLYAAEEIRRIYEAAGVKMKAMILLGINSGFGNSDCGTMPLSALDLERGWLAYPRPKTGVARRCPLWPETVEALRAVLARRPEPKNEADTGLVFVTQRGVAWAKDTSDAPITKEMRKLLKKLGINGHRNFYTLRHTFRTIADEAKDQLAADYIMGHEVPHISSVYRETISDARLRAVTDHVRVWLFPTSRPDQGGEEE